MVGVAAAGIGAASGLVSAYGDKKSGDAAGDAADFAYMQYLQQRKDMKPWHKAGKKSVNTLRGLMKDGYFTDEFDPSMVGEDAGYKFRVAQGEKAINRAGAARGNFFSGKIGKQLMNYGQMMGSEEYGNAYNREMSERDRRFGRLDQVSGRGFSAASGMVQAGQNMTNIYNPQKALEAGYKGKKANSYLDAITGGFDAYGAAKAAQV